MLCVEVIYSQLRLEQSMALDTVQAHNGGFADACLMLAMIDVPYFMFHTVM